jgi:hypothetical protein
MTWLDVDGARAYLAQFGSKRPSRADVYKMAREGLRVVRVGDADRKDSRGRRVALHMRFAAEWIDEFMIARSSSTRDG